MRRFLFRVGAIAVILGGAMGLQAAPGVCEGEGCEQCGYECLTFDDCFDDLGAQWYQKCVCGEGGYCRTDIEWDCPEPE